MDCLPSQSEGGAGDDKDGPLQPLANHPCSEAERAKRGRAGGKNNYSNSLHQHHRWRCEQFGYSSPIIPSSGTWLQYTPFNLFVETQLAASLHLLQVLKTETERTDTRVGPCALLTLWSCATQIRFVTHLTILTVSYLRVAVRPL